MPRREWRLRVQDMLRAIERIDQYVAGIERDAFMRNREKIDAVIYNLRVIGEAAHHVPDRVKESAPQIPWRQIRGMRNLLAHVYWGTEAAEAWKTAQNDLPALREALQRLQQENIDLDGDSA